MKHKKIISSFLAAIGLMFCIHVLGQAPEIEWQNSFGGNKLEVGRVGRATFDGGYIITGDSNSGIAGDKTDPSKGAKDYWILKLDSIGEIEWQKTIGGNKEEMSLAIQQTVDSGFIIGGHSSSGISFDKTEPNRGPAGTYDFWIVKLNSNGQIEWEKTIGGSGEEYLNDIAQTPDGGYIFCGVSESGISGDKTEMNFGLGDFWVVKLNENGIIEWQKTIGGNLVENAESVVLSDDGGYLIGGYSSSGISGNKTEGNMGDSDTYDYLVVKLDSSGALVWQNTIGGDGSDVLKEVCKTFDGGYILGGHSESESTGDKTIENQGAFSTNDYWVVKINEFGIIEWQQVVSAPVDDYLYSIKQVLDGGFILLGFTYSGEGYDKSEDNLGEAFTSDLWIVKLDYLGELEWENTIWGDSYDYVGAVIQTPDLGYLISAGSMSGLSGDKTEVNMGLYDYWIIKLFTDCNPEPEICNGFDDDCNGSRDDGLTFLDYYTDADLDGYGDMFAAAENSCVTIMGSVPNNFDCNDIDNMINPLTIEICNLIDDNCNGLIDDGITETITISAGGPITFCQGGSVSLTATYSGATVQWKKNGTNIPGATSATYNVTTKGNYSCVTTSACDTTESTPIFVNVIKNPNASISAGGPTTFCAGGSVVLTEVAVAGCTYQWYKGATPIAGATSLTYTATTSGNYKCRVTKAATGCYKNSNAIAVSVPCKEGLSAGEAGEMVENEIVIYPNPAMNILTINTNNNQNKIINLYDALGRLINSQIASENEVFLNVENLPAGTYFIQIVEHQIVSTYNFIKQ